MLAGPLFSSSRNGKWLAGVYFLIIGITQSPKHISPACTGTPRGTKPKLKVWFFGSRTKRFWTFDQIGGLQTSARNTWKQFFGRCGIDDPLNFDERRLSAKSGVPVLGIHQTEVRWLTIESWQRSIIVPGATSARLVHCWNLLVVDRLYGKGTIVDSPRCQSTVDTKHKYDKLSETRLLFFTFRTFGYQNQPAVKKRFNSTVSGNVYLTSYAPAASRRLTGAHKTGRRIMCVCRDPVVVMAIVQRGIQFVGLLLRPRGSRPQRQMTDFRVSEVTRHRREGARDLSLVVCFCAYAEHLDFDALTLITIRRKPRKRFELAHLAAGSPISHCELLSACGRCNVRVHSVDVPLSYVLPRKD